MVLYRYYIYTQYRELAAYLSRRFSFFRVSFPSVKTVFVISVAGKASNKLIRYILNYFTG